MDKLREAAMAALDALSHFVDDYQSEDGLDSMKHYAKRHTAAIAGLRAALAEHAPIRKPIAWLCKLVADDGTTRTQFVEQDPAGLRWNDAGEPSPYSVTPLVDALAEQEPARVPLTDDEIDAIQFGDDAFNERVGDVCDFTQPLRDFARAVEVSHGIGAAP